MRSREVDKPNVQGHARLALALQLVVHPPSNVLYHIHASRKLNMCDLEQNDFLWFARFTSMGVRQCACTSLGSICQESSQGNYTAQEEMVVVRKYTYLFLLPLWGSGGFHTGVWIVRAAREKSVKPVCPRVREKSVEPMSSRRSREICETG